MSTKLNQQHSRIAVVTGSSRGLGKRVAIRLATQGIAVALVGRDVDALDQVRTQIENTGGKAIAVGADVADEQSVDQLREMVLSQLGVPTILVNAAGIFGPIQTVQNSDAAQWIRTLMINTVGPYLTCRAFVAGMIKQGWGRIVNFSSAASLHPPGALNSAYGTSKVALNQFTRQLAAELAGTGVTANVIHPGDVKTDMWASIRDAADALGPLAQGYRKWVRWVEDTGGDDPEKAGELILQLLHDDHANTTGEFLWIDRPLQSPVPAWDKNAKILPPWAK